MKKIAVFCGSSIGVDPVFKEQAMHLGERIAKEGMTLVYGGAKVGIMGILADSVLAHGGEVIGVMPTSLHEREVFHEELTELHIVETMHDRKQMMMELADAFIVFPGGVGTMEEFFEVFTWNMIGILNKPCMLFNLNGYYELLIQFFNHMEQQQFLQSEVRQKLLVKTSIEEMINELLNGSNKA